jgi:hypothetical protein
MTTNINEPKKELVNKEFFIFRRFHVNAKDIKCHFQWWEKHESMFPIVGLNSLHVRFQALLVHKLKFKGCFLWQ